MWRVRHQVKFTSLDRAGSTFLFVSGYAQLINNKRYSFVLKTIARASLLTKPFKEGIVYLCGWGKASTSRVNRNGILIRWSFFPESIHTRGSSAFNVNDPFCLNICSGIPCPLKGTRSKRGERNVFFFY